MNALARTSIGRFELLERIGSGAGAVVYRARDTHFGQDIALKTFRADDPGTRDQLRRDFRIVCELEAPELPRMYELFEVDRQAVVVMELFRGEDVEDLLGSGRLQPRAVACGLLRGLAALHERGLVHGDVKPANLLIRDDGRVVLADLGLSRRADRRRDGVGGTLEYFAPEVVRRGETTAASDMYAAGLILHEVLGGTALSAERRRALHLAAMVGRPPPPPPTDDAALARLAGDLLHRDPVRRPSARQACERLGLGTPADDHWVGRERELARLEQWWDGALGVCVVRGQSGVGKTRLVDRFVARLRARGVVVLRSRCHANARVPFHGFEAVVDDLSSEIPRLPETLRRPLEAAFPFLVRPAADTTEPSPEPEPAPLPGELARSLRALLQAVDGPVCWVIDDAQWLDADSQRVFLGLSGMRARVLLVGRHDADTLLERLAPDAELLALEPLAIDDAVAWLARRAPSLPADELRRKAERSGGSPLLLDLLATADADADVDAAWRARFAPLSPEARTALELLAVAGVPMRVPDLLTAIADEPSWAALRELEDHGLIEWLIDGEVRRVFLSHVRIAEALGTVGAPSGMAVARRLEALDVEPLLLASVYRNAGDHARAAAFAWPAVEDALRRGAFAVAFEWCRFLLAQPAVDVSRADLLRAAARACAGLGRPVDAAQTLEQACDCMGPGVDVARSRAEAALHWLGAGHARPGLEQLRRASRELGAPLPSHRLGAWARSLVDAAWLATHGLELAATPSRDPTLRARLEAAKAASGPLMFLDYSTAVATLVRYLRLALAAGDVDHACRAAALVWNGLAQTGRPSRQREALRIFLDRHAPAAGRDVQAFVEATRAYVAIYSDRLGASIELLDRALTLYDPRRGDLWDQPFTRVQRLIARHFVEPCSAAWAAEVDRLRDALAEAGNLLSSAMVDSGVGYAADLHRGQPRLAVARLARARAVFDEMPAAYAWIDTFARIRIALYEDDLDAATRALAAGPPRVLHGVQHVRVAWHWLDGLVAVRLAVAGDAAALQRAVRAGARLARERGHWGVGHVDALEAAIAALRGRHEVAEARWARAMAAYRDAGLLAFAELAPRAFDRAAGWHRLFWPLIAKEAS